jgi:hypothetical protein
VAEVEVFPHWTEAIDAMAPHIGLSIRAFGELEEGDAGGKRGPIVQSLTHGESVDYVTKAGAGGEIGALIESARNHEEQPADPELMEAVSAVLDEVGEGEWVNSQNLWFVEASHLYESIQTFRERTISKEERIALAKKGQAIPVKDGDGNITSGRFPMANCGDVKAAAQSIGRTEDSAKIKPFITRVAKKLGCPVPFQESGSGRTTPNKEGDMPEGTELSEAQTKVRQLEETVSTRDTELKEAKDEASHEKDRADRAEDKLLHQEAARVVAGVVSETEGLPKKAAARVIESTLRSDLPTDSDGKLDKDTLKERAASKTKDEIDYLNGVTGGSGKVRGFGESDDGGSNDGAGEEELAEALGNYLDLPEKVAKHAAKGR